MSLRLGIAGALFLRPPPPPPASCCCDDQRAWPRPFVTALHSRPGSSTPASPTASWTVLLSPPHALGEELCNRVAIIRSVRIVSECPARQLARVGGRQLPAPPSTIPDGVPRSSASSRRGGGGWGTSRGHRLAPTASACAADDAAIERLASSSPSPGARCGALIPDALSRGLFVALTADPREDPRARSPPTRAGGVMPPRFRSTAVSCASSSRRTHVPRPGRRRIAPYLRSPRSRCISARLRSSRSYHYVRDTGLASRRSSSNIRLDLLFPLIASLVARRHIAAEDGNALSSTNPHASVTRGHCSPRRSARRPPMRARALRDGGLSIIDGTIAGASPDHEPLGTTVSASRGLVGSLAALSTRLPLLADHDDGVAARDRHRNSAGGRRGALMTALLMHLMGILPRRGL